MYTSAARAGTVASRRPADRKAGRNIETGMDLLLASSAAEGMRSNGIRVYRLYSQDNFFPVRRVCATVLGRSRELFVAPMLGLPHVPPKIEYGLTTWGKAKCPALDALLEWAARRPKQSLGAG
jgi:hypothetical protein